MNTYYNFYHDTIKTFFKKRLTMKNKDFEEKIKPLFSNDNYTNKIIDLIFNYENDLNDLIIFNEKYPTTGRKLLKELNNKFNVEIEKIINLKNKLGY